MTPIRHVLSMSLAAGFAAVVLLAQGPEVVTFPRDGGATLVTRGTAEISGVVVVDSTNPAPLRRATVTLRDTDRGASRIAVTDEKGVFRFGELPDGRFTISAVKPAYVQTTYGARVRGGPGLSIALEAGQRVGDVRIALPRGGVLTGRVTDDLGRAVPNVRVIAAERVTVGGEPTFRAVGGLGTPTDDLGVFRLHSLPAGNYVLVASFFGGGLGGAARATTDAEVQWALRAPAVAPGTSRPVLSQAPPAGPPMRYVTAFYPAVTDPSLATVVPLAAGEEKGGLDFTVPLVPAATVRGTISRFDGQPVRNALVVAVPLGRASLNIPIIEIPPRATVQPSGEFTVAGLQPGRYLISARAASGAAPPVPGPAAGGRGVPAPPVNDLWATADITITGEDIGGLRLDLAPGMSVGGRIVFEGATPPPAIDGGVFVNLQVPPGTGAALSAGSPQINADGTFSFSSVPPGSFVLNSSLRNAGPQNSGLNPPPWMLRSATLDGRDVLDTPFEVRAGADVTNIAVTYTDRVTQVSGRVTDPGGRPVPTYSVIVFSTESRYWRQGSRWVRQPVRPASDGRYAINALPPGEYYLAVIQQFDPNEWYTPAFLQQVVPGAIRISLGDGERKVQNLTLGQ